MPELSRFFGIIIRMYMEVGGPHHLPHFHAYYQDDVAIFTLDPVDLIAGELPRRQRRLVQGKRTTKSLNLMGLWKSPEKRSPRSRRAFRRLGCVTK
jgi:hypothetical protein